jgi:hypothetical protein
MNRYHFNQDFKKHWVEEDPSSMSLTPEMIAGLMSDGPIKNRYMKKHKLAIKPKEKADEKES